MRLNLTAPAATLVAALMLPVLALPTGALAQANPAPAASPATPPQTEMRTLTPEQRAQRVEDHIAKLHAELGITADQQQHWDAFAAVMRDNATNMTKMFDQRGARLETMSAVDNLQSFADVAAQHAQNMQHLATSFQSLYNSLSDSQKHAADTLFRDGVGPGRKP